MDNMFDILLRLPLFNGASRERIAEIAGSTKLHFLKYLPDDTIVTAGDPCTHIKFIISGKGRFTIANFDNRFKVSQTLQAPVVIAPENLFGPVTTYPCTGVALEPTGILQIAKSDFLKILYSDQVFMLNYLNILSLNAQKSTQGILAITTGNLEERIAFWIVALTQRSGTDISLSCRQRDLYSLFGVQRTSFIAALSAMRDQGLIEFNQNEIRVISRDSLVSLLQSPSED